MSSGIHQQFTAIVLGGSKKNLGMPSFAGTLDDKAVAAIRAFVISEALKAKKQQDKKQENIRG
jgi:mono/diheme cytochrome c family protein